MRWLLLCFTPILLIAKDLDVSAVTALCTDTPATSMIISWHSLPNDGVGTIRYRKVGDDLYTSSLAESRTPLKNLSTHFARLDHLAPDTTYEFLIAGDSHAYTFKTLPSDSNAPLRFVVGGDVYRKIPRFEKSARIAAQLDPDLVILGGDIAYSLEEFPFFKRRGWEAKRWHTFFERWSELMRDSQGRLIPTLIAAGNHDVKGPFKEGKKSNRKTLYYDFIPNQTTYRAVDITPQFSLILLDTGHGVPIGGAQAQWLEQTLKDRLGVPLKCAVYHQAAYPSYYSQTGLAAQRIRDHWTPLFDAYGVKVAFEHDNHTYKRTHPLRGGQIDPNGTLYIGDGCWGVKPRKPHTPNKLPYLSKSLPSNHIILGKLSSNRLSLTVYDNFGKILDYTDIKYN